MSDQAIIAQVSTILDGWTPTQSMGALAHRSGNSWLIGGVFNGTPYIKHTGLAPDGPDTPDDPIKAAHWLVTHVAGLHGSASISEPIVEIEQTPLSEIMEAYDESFDDMEPIEAGDGEPAYDGPSSDVGEAENVRYPDDPDPSNVADEPELVPANLGGVLIQGDALATAKAIALMAVDDERFARVGDYDKTANQSRLDELRAIQQAIREGVHPQFTDIEAQELQALETFLPWIQRIDDHAQALRNEIRAADDLEVLTAIDIINGWPE